MIQKYTFLSILFLLFTGCKPHTVYTEHALSNAVITDIQNLKPRLKRSITNQHQMVQVLNPANTFIINKESIPEKDRRPELSVEYDATHQIYYLPILSNNLTEKDLNVIKRALSLGQWITAFPLGVDYSYLHYKESNDKNKNLFRLVEASIDEPIELNFEDLDKPFVKIHKKDGSVIHTGELFRDLIHIKSFSTGWSLNDWDIKFANDIKGLSHPIRSGDTIYLIFIQVAQYHKPDFTHDHYYLNPIRMDYIDHINYVVD